MCFILWYFGDIPSLPKKLQGTSCSQKFYKEAVMENFPVFPGQRLRDGGLFKVAVCWLATFLRCFQNFAILLFYPIEKINRSKMKYISVNIN